MSGDGWDDGDMARAYLAGYNEALTARTDFSDPVPADLVEIADDFAEWIGDYELDRAAGATAPETTPACEKPCATCRGRGEVWCPYEWVVCGSCGGSGVVET